MERQLLMDWTLTGRESWFEQSCWIASAAEASFPSLNSLVRVLSFSAFSASSLPRPP